jgi:hypothetical protein
MANTKIRESTCGNMDVYVFETTSAATSETVQLPINKNFVCGVASYIGGTPTTTSFSYVKATGVGTFATLTATNNVIMTVFTE